MSDYTKLTNLEVTGHLKVAGQEVTPGGGGSGGGALIVHESYDEESGAYVLDKTWQEIADAAQIGPVIVLSDSEDVEGRLCTYPVLWVHNINDADYGVSCEGVGGRGYQTFSPSGYPSYIPD